jgi:hypothetical protein
MMIMIMNYERMKVLVRMGTGWGRLVVGRDARIEVEQMLPPVPSAVPG